MLCEEHQYSSEPRERDEEIVILGGIWWRGYCCRQGDGACLRIDVTKASETSFKLVTLISRMAVVEPGGRMSKVSVRMAAMLLTVLFCVSLQANFASPAKYGILPEIAERLASYLGRRWRRKIGN